MQKIKRLFLEHPAFIFLFIFLVFYPIKFVSIDEFSYVGAAYRLTDGELLQECDPSYPGQFTRDDGLCIMKYNIGTSLFFIPAVVLDERLVFATTCLVFLLSVSVAARIINLLGVSPLLIYTYAFFPAFVYFSRTAFSEVFSLTASLICLWAMLEYFRRAHRKWLIIIALSFALAVFIRYTMVVPLIVLLVGFIYRILVKEGLTQVIKAIILIAAIGLPFALLFCYLNIYLYGAPLRSGYFFSGEETFTLNSFIPMFLKYFLVLNIIYPLMLVVPLASGRKLAYWLVAPVFATIAFYSLSANSLFQGELLDFITGIRFLVPVIPLAIFANLLVWDHWLRKSISVKRVFICACIVMVTFSVALSFIHARFLSTTATPWPDLQEYFANQV